MTTNQVDGISPCQHVLVQVLSFHTKDFCIASECTKCHGKFEKKHLSYRLLDGKFGVMIQDEKLRPPLKINLEANIESVSENPIK